MALVRGPPVGSERRSSGVIGGNGSGGGDGGGGGGGGGSRGVGVSGGSGESSSSGAGGSASCCATCCCACCTRPHPCCARFARRCCPRTAAFVQATCVIAIIGFVTTLLFGRSVTAMVQGFLGIIFSVETFFAAARGARRVLQLYALFSVLNTGAAIIVGVIVLSGVEFECAGAQNMAACVSTQEIYGLIMALGASSVGVVAAINTGLLSLTMPAKPPPDPLERKLGT